MGTASAPTIARRRRLAHPTGRSLTKRPALRDEDIIVDTREQRPLFDTPPAQLVGIPTGDYSIVGHTATIAIERKSLPDLLGSVGRGRERFREEFVRLSDIRYRAVVIEGTMSGLMKQRRWGRVTPAHAIGTMASWAIEYQVPVFFCDDRSKAKWLTHTLLRLAYEKVSRTPPPAWTCGCREHIGAACASLPKVEV